MFVSPTRGSSEKRSLLNLLHEDLNLVAYEQLADVEGESVASTAVDGVNVVGKACSGCWGGIVSAKLLTISYS